MAFLRHHHGVEGTELIVHMGARTIAVVFPHWHDRHGEHGWHHSSMMFEGVVRRFAEVSALVEVDSPGIVLMEARGPSRYFGGDMAVAERLWTMCADIGESAGVGVADSRFAALVAAHLSHRRDGPLVVATGRTQGFIDASPITLLSSIADVEADVVDLFSRLGLGTCGDVRALGEAALIDRFGVIGETVFRLVSEGDVRLFDGDVPTEDMAVTFESDAPLTMVQEVVSAVRPMVASMIGAISARGRRCLRLVIRCDTDDGESMARVWAESRGFSTEGVLERVGRQVEGWLTPDEDSLDDRTRGVTTVSIVALECHGSIATQAVLWGGHEENTERAVRCLSQVLAIDAGISITVPRWVGGRDITKAYVHVDVTTVDIGDTKATLERVGGVDGFDKKWTGSLPAPWPAWVFTDPETIMVLDRDHVVVGVTGRHEFTSMPAFVSIGSRTHRIVRVAGPWPVEERWWDPRRARRHVRAQLLIDAHDGGSCVLLVVLEHATWKLVARHD